MIFSKQDNKVTVEIPMNNEVKDLNGHQPEKPVKRARFLNCIGQCIILYKRHCNMSIF